VLGVIGRILTVMALALLLTTWWRYVYRSTEQIGCLTCPSAPPRMVRFAFSPWRQTTGWRRGGARLW